MIDTNSAQAALWARAATLVIATTGPATLAATTTGYTRSAGSFITDGFKVGMEILPAGFGANPYDVVKSVTATTLTTASAHAAQAAGAGRSITAGMPELVFYEDVTQLDASGNALKPISGRPYVEEEMVPATQTLFSAPAAGGEVEESGVYVIRWHGLSGRGPEAIRASMDALKALFLPETTLVAGSHTVRVRGRPGPFAGQIRPVDGGWSLLTLNIPYYAFSNNT